MEKSGYCVTFTTASNHLWVGGPSLDHARVSISNVDFFTAWSGIVGVVSPSSGPGDSRLPIATAWFDLIRDIKLVEECYRKVGSCTHRYLLKAVAELLWAFNDKYVKDHVRISVSTHGEFDNWPFSTNSGGPVMY